jgi:hypothetical protein
MQRFGAAFGIAIVTAVFTANGHLGSASSVTSGYRPALAVAAGISLAGAVAAAFTAARRRPVPPLAAGEVALADGTASVTSLTGKAAPDRAAV